MDIVREGVFRRRESECGDRMTAFSCSRPFLGGLCIAEVAVAMRRTNSACRHHARWVQTRLVAAERSEALDRAVVKLIENERVGATLSRKEE